MGYIKIVGQVTGFHERVEEERHWWQYFGKIVNVWSFRIERFDEAGNRLPPIQIEMRGSRFTGSIDEGDKVEIQGKWQEGKVMQVKEVTNLTTGVTIKAKG